jgi:iron-sulfur cluster assembly accessory protein
MTDTTFPIKLTDEAANKANQLLVREGREDLRLRVRVSPGGCSGLIYSLFYDDQTYDGDLIDNYGELEIVVDKMSAPYLEGAVVSFEDTIAKQGFNIENPNAAGSCACGDSFH